MEQPTDSDAKAAPYISVWQNGGSFPELALAIGTQRTLKPAPRDTMKTLKRAILKRAKFPVLRKRTANLFTRRPTSIHFYLAGVEGCVAACAFLSPYPALPYSLLGLTAYQASKGVKNLMVSFFQEYENEYKCERALGTKTIIGSAFVTSALIAGYFQSSNINERKISQAANMVASFCKRQDQGGTMQLGDSGTYFKWRVVSANYEQMSTYDDEGQLISSSGLFAKVGMTVAIDAPFTRSYLTGAANEVTSFVAPYYYCAIPMPSNATQVKTQKYLDQFRPN